jgi:hypothetical protein
LNPTPTKLPNPIDATKAVLPEVNSNSAALIPEILAPAAAAQPAADHQPPVDHPAVAPHNPKNPSTVGAGLSDNDRETPIKNKNPPAPTEIYRPKFDRHQSHHRYIAWCREPIEFIGLLNSVDSVKGGFLF